MTQIEEKRIRRIKELHTEFYNDMKKALPKAIEVGELLTKQKAAMKHGEFLSWVKKNLPFSERTARNYMKLFRENKKIKSASIADLTSAYKMIEHKPRAALPPRVEPPVSSLCIFCGESKRVFCWVNDYHRRRYICFDCWNKMRRFLEQILRRRLTERARWRRLIDQMDFRSRLIQHEEEPPPPPEEPEIHPETQPEPQMDEAAEVPVRRIIRSSDEHRPQQEA